MNFLSVDYKKVWFEFCLLIKKTPTQPEMNVFADSKINSFKKRENKKIFFKKKKNSNCPYQIFG